MQSKGTVEVGRRDSRKQSSTNATFQILRNARIYPPNVSLVIFSELTKARLLCLVFRPYRRGRELRASIRSDSRKNSRPQLAWNYTLGKVIGTIKSIFSEVEVT
jgi:hypothetical protein